MSKFKVGDRVRLDYGHSHYRSIGAREGTVVRVNEGFDVVVAFDGYVHGWSEEGTPCNRWGFDDESLRYLIIVSASPPAKFQVVYIEGSDETFDTQEAAETAARRLAHNEPGSKFAVFKRIATATTGAVEIERFA